MNFWIALLMLYLASVALVHAWSEYDGRLWHYFGALTGADWLAYLSTKAGLKIFVLAFFALVIPVLFRTRWQLDD